MEAAPKLPFDSTAKIPLTGHEFQDSWGLLYSLAVLIHE